MPCICTSTKAHKDSLMSRTADAIARRSNGNAQGSFNFLTYTQAKNY